MDAAGKIGLLRQMVLVRQFETEWGEAYRREEISGPPPGLSTGQEAVSVGACAALEPGDYVFATHRGQGAQIAMGLDIRRVMAELYCRRTGYNKGKALKHVTDFKNGVVGMGGITGAQAPVAAGMALAQKLKGTDRVSVCFFGDGASNEGAVYEAANLAAIWSLPLILICENNEYCISMPAKAVAKVDIVHRGPGFGLPGVAVDGNDVLAMYDAVATAVARARASEGPTWMEAKTYRLAPHLMHDPQTYRSKEEIAARWQQCPISRYRQELLAEGVITESGIAAMEAEVGTRVAEAVEYARQSPFPALEEAFEDLWA